MTGHQAQAGARAEKERPMAAATVEVEGGQRSRQKLTRGQGTGKAGAQSRPQEPADQDPVMEGNGCIGGGTGGGGRAKRQKEKSGGTRAVQETQEDLLDSPREARTSTMTGDNQEGNKRAKTTPSRSQAAGGGAKGL